LLDEVIANHFYRQGRFGLGETFAKEAQVDVDESLKLQFREMYQISEAIKSKNLGPALEWARKHHDALVLRGSSLEFRLHHLQYVTHLLDGNKEQGLEFPSLFSSSSFPPPLSFSHLCSFFSPL